ncbi:MAG: polymer-forming cytoskeletal protein [Deltaproteobacteria bacterium]|nr:polymer-forming cytoskeletal protein [Deltaproteobacteria bacterium]
MLSKNIDKLESFVGSNARIKGEMTVEGTLRLDGTIEGGLNADCVILSEKAMVKGDITAQKIVIAGTVEGNLRANELVEIQSKGKVLGGVFTPRLAVIEGGEINGKIEMKMEESQIIDFEAKARD